MIKLIINGTDCTVKWTRFSDNALLVEIINELPDTIDKIVYAVDSETCNFSELPMALSLLAETLEISYPATSEAQPEVTLYMPYLPYARADRRFGPKQSSGLHTFISTLCTLVHIDRVVLEDIHNPTAAIELFEWYEVEVLHQEVKAATLHITRVDLIVAPDKGAVTRAEKVASHENLPIVYATKTRDPANGRILSCELECSEDLKGKIVMIVDDICDGGGTFIPLAQALKAKGALKVYLYVSHGIFSKGLEPLIGHIDKIIVSNLVCEYITPQDLIRFNSGSLVAVGETN